MLHDEVKAPSFDMQDTKVSFSSLHRQLKPLL